MALSSFLLTKNDSGQNLIENSQWWAFGHCRGFQNMATLPKRLQTQSFYAHQLQQLTPLHKYKEFELQAGLLGPEAFYVSFLDWLTPKQDEWGCKCTVLFFSEKQRWRK